MRISDPRGIWANQELEMENRSLGFHRSLTRQIDVPYGSTPYRTVRPYSYGTEPYRTVPYVGTITYRTVRYRTVQMQISFALPGSLHL